MYWLEALLAIMCVMAGTLCFALLCAVIYVYTKKHER